MIAERRRREIVASLVPAMLEAGAKLLARRGSVTASRKPDQSPVTEADLESQAMLIAALTAIAPEYGVVAEEHGSALRAPEPGTPFFLVDPLDGTREYLEGRDDFAICIALVEQGVPVLGLVAVPAEGAVYVTTGTGVMRHTNGEAERPLVRAPAEAKLRVAASRSHPDPRTGAALARLPAHTLEREGSAVKFVRLAQGAVDLYPRLGPVSAWDIAAGHALIAASGGVMLAADGEPLRYEAVEPRVPGFVAARDAATAETFLRAAALPPPANG